MSRLLGLIAALVVLALAEPLAARAAPVEPEREVLVLLRLPPPHFRAGSDYASGYGDSQGAGARRRMAEQLARKHGLTPVEDWPMPLIGVDCFVMAAPAGKSAAEAAEALAHDPGVAWAEPMNTYRGQGAASPNDPLYPAQPAASAWRLGDLHEIATGKGVRVAVIDSKVETGHPDLKGQVETAQDFVSARPATGGEAHGTGVAGVIAAIADNNLGIAGVAPRARLMALRACWQTEANGASDTVCDTLSLAKALYYALSHNAEVINMSLAGPPDILLGQLVDAALAKGAVVVGAVDPARTAGGFPASHAGVLAVTDRVGAAAAGVYAAPGRDVPTTEPGGRWYLVNGSSYAAAHVSGLAALVREKAPARPAAVTLVTARSGGGAIDACATLLKASGPCDCACARAAK